MMFRSLSSFAVALLLGLFGAQAVHAAELADLWSERVKSVVAVEFYTELETERRPTVAFGTVIDRNGTIILQPNAINTRLPASLLKDFRVYQPGRPVSEYASAEYLGVDAASGWHFIRVAETMRKDLVPVTEFTRPGSTDLKIADAVWGIGLRGKDEDFAPYLMASQVALVETLPQKTAVALGNTGAPNLPVFDKDGFFSGLGLAGFGESFLQYSRNERGSSVLLISIDETRVFKVASEVLADFRRVPQNINGRPLAWLGTYGLQPLETEAAKFLNLENQSAIVISEVLENSPAAKAGVKDRDILVALDGRPLPRLKPDRVMPLWLDREVALRVPGDKMKLTVLRDQAQVDIEVTLGDEPKAAREADRKYFERVGLTVREFVYADGVVRRVGVIESVGVVAQFVKNNGPAAIAGLRTDDWIREIDGVVIKTFAEAVEKLAAIEADKTRAEAILLTSRNGETSVVRIKLK